MSNVVPPRGVLTDQLIDWLEAQLAPKVLVGDHSAPQEGGWDNQGEPNAGLFVPYVTVKTGPANPADREGANRRHASWLMSYGLGQQAALRTQCDWLADLVRALCVTIPQIANGEAPWMAGWKVQESYYGALGRIELSNATSPPSFGCEDVVVLRVERERS